MGFTTGDKCYEDLNMEQTPANIAKVLDRAGWTHKEAVAVLDGEVSIAGLVWAMRGTKFMEDRVWRLLLDKAGRRVFDAE